MAESICQNCGSTYYWKWEDAFAKFGFGDGEGQVETSTVAIVLKNAGYVVDHQRWALHNDVITSIKKDGVEQIPESACVGYDDPRAYLPRKIIKTLDAAFCKPREGVR